MATAEQQALDFNPELQDVSRQRKLAELLMAQGFNQPQGQMISGHYVAPSWTQQLAPIANVLAGQAIGERADTEQSKLAEALRGKQQEVMQAYAQAKTPQEKFAIGTSQYAPAQLKAAMFEKLKGQKVGEGESILDFDLTTGEYSPIATGGMKAAPEIKQAMQQLGLNKPLDQLTPQELQMVNAKIDQLNASKRSSLTVHMPTEGERKAGFLSNILDKNLYQMQSALGVDPSAVKPNVPASIVEAITGPNLLSRSITPAQRQIIEDSQLDVLDTALTLSTGAAYTREQLVNKRSTYFPVLGDKPPAIAAKQKRLESLLDSAFIMAGRATPNRVSASNFTTVAPTPNANKELNIPAAPAAPKFLGFEPKPAG